MEKTNHFSSRFAPKSSEELKQITKSNDYSIEAKQAAIWELEKRGEADQEQINLGVEVEKEEEKKIKIARKRYELNKYSTFWPRFLAGIIDAIVLFAVFMIPTFVFGAVMEDVIFTWYYDITLDLLFYVYYIAMHARYGQTLGKMAMGVKVVRNSDESNIGLREAFLRDLVPVVLILAAFMATILTNTFDLDYGFFSLIGYVDNISTIWILAEIITMLTNEKRRAIHDFIAGTVVIRTH